MKFSKNLEPFTYEAVPRPEPQNIRRHGTIFVRPGDLATGICAPLLQYHKNVFLLNLKLNPQILSTEVI